LPLSAGVIAALGGLTYPLYLLHQHIGFILLNRSEGLAPAAVLIPAVALAMLLLSFMVWRYIERPGQKFLKAWLVEGFSLVQQRLQRFELRRVPGAASASPQIIAIKR
jgi:peptidoglycan/LPS O-acetylase OafA/YrhL